jgi:hypothetical protein
MRPLTLLILLSASATLYAQPSPPAKPCAAPEFRQFDFWVGNWRVENPKGKLVGHNRISKIHGGCVIEERWKGQGGMTGSSLNIYDASSKRWHQTWADSSGLLLQLDGEARPGGMTLRGQRSGADGAPLHDRISWTRLEKGRVRQLWEQSTDGGKTWSLYFDGIYIPQRTKP